MTYDLLIKNGTLVSSEGEVLMDIAVLNGKIAAQLTPGQDIDAREVIDAKGLHVFPGIVDGHCHMREILAGWKERISGQEPRQQQQAVSQQYVKCRYPYLRCTPQRF